MMDYVQFAQIALMVVAGLCYLYAAYCFGRARGIRETARSMHDAAKADMANVFQKLASRREAVPEFIAPGEFAEVIELEYPDAYHPDEKEPSYGYQQKCFGCQYAGRYVLPRS